MSNIRKLCVIGAGAVGLSTAVQLQDRFPDYAVTIMADRFHSETLSNGAGGIFRVSPSVQGPRISSVSEWVEFGFQHYNCLLHSEESAVAGIQEVSGYMLFHDKKTEQKEALILKDFTPSVRVLTEDEINRFPGDFKGGLFYTTLLIDCNKYLPFLLERFTRRGGRVVEKTVNGLNELINEFDVVVNCGGLRGGDLCDDTKIVPLRGQVFRVNAPWIKHFYYADLDTYILPSTDTVVLGGTRQYHSYNTNVDKYDSASIWERCCQLIPSLKHAEVVKEWVGLRPHRDPIRVESEVRDFGNDGQLKIVHNYGHGGYGICLSWGSAKEAVDLVGKLLVADNENVLASKL